MENVVLVIHLLLALSLIGIVLMQRSEGGGLGMGGGGGGLVSARGVATALSKLTWVLAIGFICTSVLLTIIARDKADGASVVDGIAPAAESSEGTAPAIDGESLLPPSTSGGADGPLIPDGN